LIPDITIKVVIDDQKNAKIFARAYPIILTGRYTKKWRGLSQKQSKNQLFAGKDSGRCDFSGLSGHNSIEGIIAKRLISITKGESPKFLWVGSEDQDSLVLGRGRPFFVRISNPRVRRLKRSLKISTDGIYAIIDGKSKKIPQSPLQFVTKTKILVQSNGSLTKNELAKLNALSNSMVRFRIKSKIVTKKIYSVNVKKINDRNFFLTVIADGGLLIKQFIGGQEYMEPNVSEIVGTKSECIFFDILDVRIQ
jgi:tRNA pseudouridine synthase 10